MAQKAKAISEAPSDKELIEQQSNQINSQNVNIAQITMQSAVSNAISQGITSEEVFKVRQSELKREQELEGETKGD